MSVTAVVCAYWSERFGNVDRAVDDLLTGSHVPDTIIVLNNSEVCPDQFDHWKAHGVKVLKGWNTETRGKYVAALLAYADWYLLLDDDITVGHRTLEYLLEHAYAGLVTANRGAVMNDGSFYNATLVDADKIPIRTSVDSVHGSGVFCAHSALVDMLDVEDLVRDKWPTQGDDILMGFANRGTCEIFPMKHEAAWVNLDPCGVALNELDGYYDMRDEFTRDLLEVLDA